MSQNIFFVKWTLILIGIKSHRYVFHLMKFDENQPPLQKCTVLDIKEQPTLVYSTQS